MMMCQGRFLYCHKGTTLVGLVDYRGGYAFGKTENIWELCVLYANFYPYNCSTSKDKLNNQWKINHCLLSPLTSQWSYRDSRAELAETWPVRSGLPLPDPAPTTLAGLLISLECQACCTSEPLQCFLPTILPTPLSQRTAMVPSYFPLVLYLIVTSSTGLPHHQIWKCTLANTSYSLSCLIFHQRTYHHLTYYVFYLFTFLSVSLPLEHKLCVGQDFTAVHSPVTEPRTWEALNDICWKAKWTAWE